MESIFYYIRYTQPMKYTRQGSIVLWNGITALPENIHVLHSSPHLAEFELLSTICGLHGYVTAFDVLTGADSGTEKDTDLTAVQEAFQAFVAPRMPMTRYDSGDKRVLKSLDAKRLSRSIDA